MWPAPSFWNTLWTEIKMESPKNQSQLPPSSHAPLLQPSNCHWDEWKGKWTHFSRYYRSTWSKFKINSLFLKIRGITHTGPYKHLLQTASSKMQLFFSHKGSSWNHVSLKIKPAHSCCLDASLNSRLSRRNVYLIGECVLSVQARNWCMGEGERLRDSNKTSDD